MSCGVVCSVIIIHGRLMYDLRAGMIESCETRNYFVSGIITPLVPSPCPSH